MIDIIQTFRTLYRTVTPAAKLNTKEFDKMEELSDYIGVQLSFKYALANVHITLSKFSVVHGTSKNLSFEDFILKPAKFAEFVEMLLKVMFPQNHADVCSIVPQIDAPNSTVYLRLRERNSKKNTSSVCRQFSLSDDKTNRYEIGTVGYLQPFMITSGFTFGVEIFGFMQSALRQFATKEEKAVQPVKKTVVSGPKPTQEDLSAAYFARKNAAKTNNIVVPVKVARIIAYGKNSAEKNERFFEDNASKRLGSGIYGLHGIERMAFPLKLSDKTKADNVEAFIKANPNFMFRISSTNIVYLLSDAPEVITTLEDGITVTAFADTAGFDEMLFIMEN